MSSTYRRQHPSGGGTRPAPSFLLLLLALLLTLLSGKGFAAGKPSAKALAFQGVPTVLRVGQAWPTISVSLTNGGVVNTRDNKTKVTLSVASGQGTLSGTLTRTVVAGVATFPGLSYGYAGVDNVVLKAVASDTAYPARTSGTVRILAPVLSFVTQPGTPQVAGKAWPAFSLKLTFDGNTLTTDSQTRVTLSPIGGTGTLSGTLTRTAVNGVVTFDDIAYDTYNQTIRVAASASDNLVAPVTSNAVWVAEPFRVTYVYPGDNLAGAPINYTVQVRFSKPVVPTTVNAQTFVVRYGATGQTVHGTITLTDNNSRAVFTPTDLFATGTVYSVYIGTNILCAVDNSSLTQARQWTFSTQPAGWDTFTYFSVSPTGNASLGGTAAFASGNGVSAWAWFDNSVGSWRINTGRYDRFLRDTTNPWVYGYPGPYFQNAADPQLKIAPVGTLDEAVLIWAAQSNGYTQPYAGSYSFGQIAYSSIPIGPGSTRVPSTRLTVNAQGTPVVSWVGDEAYGQGLYLNRRSANNDWTNFLPVVSPQPGIAILDHQVAIGPGLTTAIAWIQGVGPYPAPVNPVSVRVSAPDGSWTYYNPVSFGAADNGARLAVGVGADDNVFLAYVTGGNLVAYRFPFYATTWTVGQLNTPTSRVLPGSVTLAVRGNEALAAWVAYDGVYKVYSARYRNGAWEPALVASAIYSLNPLSGLVSTFDGRGNAFAAWSMPGGPGYNFSYVSRLAAGSYAWDAPQGLSGPTSSLSELSISANDDGDAFIAWRQDGMGLGVIHYQAAYP